MRLLINTRDFNQRGQIMNIPGKLVDILTDQARSRLYVLRQDQNVVLVYDAATLQAHRVSAYREYADANGLHRGPKVSHGWQ